MNLQRTKFGVCEIASTLRTETRTLVETQIAPNLQTLLNTSDLEEILKEINQLLDLATKLVTLAQMNLQIDCTDHTKQSMLRGFMEPIVGGIQSLLGVLETYKHTLKHHPQNVELMNTSKIILKNTAIPLYFLIVKQLAENKNIQIWLFKI